MSCLFLAVPASQSTWRQMVPRLLRILASIKWLETGRTFRYEEFEGSRGKSSWHQNVFRLLWAEKGERTDKTGGVPHRPCQGTPGEPPEVRPPSPVIRQASASSPPGFLLSPRAKREASPASLCSLLKRGLQGSIRGDSDWKRTQKDRRIGGSWSLFFFHPLWATLEHRSVGQARLKGVVKLHQLKLIIQSKQDVGLLTSGWPEPG